MYLVLNKKSPFYQLVYFKDGKRSSASTGTSQLKEAEKFLKNFIVPATQLEPEAPLPASIKLKSFFEEYKNYVRSSYSVAYLERAVIPSFNKLLSSLPDLPLESISSRNLDQFISSVSAYSKSAASLYHRTLKAAFNKALAWGYIKENPFRLIKSPKVSKSLPLFITVEQLNLICENESSPFLKNIYQTAFYTGMRIGELLNMKWSWIDLNSNLITVKCSETFTTKSRKERIIPVSPSLKKVLGNISPVIIDIKKANFVFSKCKGIKLNENFVSKRFKKAVRDAELDDKIHFHSLRHSLASNLAQKGVSLYVIKELLGHEDIKTTQIYSHLQKENLALAVNLL